MSAVVLLADVGGLPVLPTGTAYATGRFDQPNVFDVSQGEDGTVIEAEVFDPRWILEIETAPLDYPDYHRMEGWVNRVRLLHHGRFLGFDPRRRRPFAAGNGVTPPSGVTLSASVPAATPRQVALAGLGAGYALSAGDHLGFVSTSGVRVVHRIVADVVADGAGAATVDVLPRVLLAAASGTAVTLDRPLALFHLDPTSLAMDIDRSVIGFRAIQVNKVLSEL
ncbi:hypothetical protein [Phreatobacter sp.]|uniref:hypothetical protein n=1 Tax=Phreatobacter sp. TaxID=1966341 RepID=UPI003F6FCDA3